jgi:hypothetical protein
MPRLDFARCHVQNDHAALRLSTASRFGLRYTKDGLVLRLSSRSNDHALYRIRWMISSGVYVGIHMYIRCQIEQPRAAFEVGDH